MTAEIDASVSDDEYENGALAKEGPEVDEDAEAIDDGSEDEDHQGGMSDDENTPDSDIGEKEESPQIDKAEITAVHIEILQQVDSGQYPLKTDKDKDIFYSKYERAYLLGRNNEGDSLLHGLLVNVKEGDALFKYRIPLLSSLLELDRDIPKWKNDREETALCVAVHKQLCEVVRHICNCSSAAVEALKIPKANGDTCLHVAIQKDLDIDFIIYLIGMLGSNMLLHKGEGGNTPLHLAVKWEHCRPSQLLLVERLVELSPTSLEIKNKESLSPFQYHILTRRRSDPNKQAPNLPQLGNKNRNGSKASLLKNTPEGNYDNKHDSKGGSSPELLRPKLDRQKRKSMSKISIMEAKKVESYLMLQCMRITDQEKALDVLYGPVPKRAIDFDLWESNYTSITEMDLTKMNSHLRFEVILRYVAIPKLSIERSTPLANTDNTTSKASPDRKGRQDYSIIFDWLRKCGVRQILRIIVQDDPAAPHSDEIIELALKDFEIEDFDWQKMDLCTETILTAAPKCKIVHLYSSGNNAVLMGWSDTGGLPKLKSLETVHLTVNPGLESVKRTNENVRVFENSLLRLCPEVKVIAKVKKAVGLTQDRIVPEKQIEQDKQKQKWLNCMDEFAAWIHNYPKMDSYERIKVALIDDGVDTAFEDLSSNIAAGVSYYKRPGGLNSSYFQSTSGHGTVMARLIRRVCPDVRIYVAKLDEKVTAASAAKAIRWATTRGVHVISMSWTIRRTNKNIKEIEDLEKALTVADRKNILLFCSASDQGNNGKKDQIHNYPAKAKPDKIFQIGAATASGKGWEWLGHGHMDFIFPGEKLLLQQQLGALPESLSGSSLATALAAGLAALILLCVELNGHMDLTQLRGYERMKDAFMAIGVSDGYVLVWESFDISREVSRHEKMFLSELVNKLLNKSAPSVRRAPTIELK